VLDEIRSTSGGVDNSTLRIDKIFKRRNDSTIEYEQNLPLSFYHRWNSPPSFLTAILNRDRDARPYLKIAM